MSDVEKIVQVNHTRRRAEDHQRACLIDDARRAQAACAAENRRREARKLVNVSWVSFGASVALSVCWTLMGRGVPALLFAAYAAVSAVLARCYAADAEAEHREEVWR